MWTRNCDHFPFPLLFTLCQIIIFELCLQCLSNSVSEFEGSSWLKGEATVKPTLQMTLWCCDYARSLVRTLTDFCYLFMVWEWSIRRIMTFENITFDIIVSGIQIRSSNCCSIGIVWRTNRLLLPTCLLSIIESSRILPCFRMQIWLNTFQIYTYFLSTSP